jgi:hypothetical protein
MAWTRTDGWVRVFACVDHYTAEAWAHVAKVSDRFAALQPVYDAVIDRWGRPVPVDPLYDTVDGLRQAVAGFVERSNTPWLIQRHGHGIGA